MRRYFLRMGLACLLALTLFSAAPAFADSDQDRARAAVESGEVKPLGAILKTVRQKYKGQVLDTQLLDLGGHWVYRVRLLTQDGQALDIGVDGKSGQIIDVQGGG
ncbi:PepSY domain-containing protein [Hypericibacter sp.]|uniref:PepSY domain-containing protein n=1 Tax=Hypericibacter sp. TaxID=2705401 RepID=UPI003D6D8E9B